MNLKDIFKKKKKYKMSFKEALDLTELPIVTFVIDDSKYNFLLDTGCTLSIINRDTLSTIKSCEILKGLTGKVFGMEGNDTVCKICRIMLNYREVQYTEEFQILNMSKSFDKLKEESGVRVHGILGTKFFQKYKYVLNFDEMIAESRC